MSVAQGAEALRWLVEHLEKLFFDLRSHSLFISQKLPRISKRIWLLVAGVTFFCFAATWSAAEDHETVKNLGPGLKDMLASDAAQVIELEGLTIGKPIEVDSSLWSKPIDAVLPALAGRFAAIATEDWQPEYMDCRITPDRYEALSLGRTSAFWRTKGIVGIAINLHNSQDVIPAQAMAVLQAAALLLKHNKVYISIYENDSHDRTGSLLSEVVAAAQALGVDGMWAVSSRMRNGENQDRMVMLSEIRNHAIAPLIPYMLTSSNKTPATLIFMNDVVTCASDILELVHQQRLQKADMVMGVDWLPQNGPPRLYDIWVARGINGALAYEFAENHGMDVLAFDDNYVHDLLNTQSVELYQRWLDGRPLPVYCMWGGMAGFDASLFTKQHLRFRSSIKSGWTGGSAAGALGDWGKLVTDSYLETDCPGASECEYICRDIWNLKHGQARVVLAPQARTTYSVGEWNDIIHLVPQTRRTERETDRDDLIDWSNVKIPHSVECIPSRSNTGELLDCWAEERYLLDPLWRMVYRFFR